MKVQIAAPITPQWIRANERAAEDRKAGRIAERIGCRLYRVPSESGTEARTVRIISVINLEATCTCPAGARNIPCKHQAQALSEAARRIAHSDAQPAPASTPAPKAAAPANAGAWVERDGMTEHLLPSELRSLTAAELAAAIAAEPTNAALQSEQRRRDAIVDAKMARFARA